MAISRKRAAKSLRSANKWLEQQGLLLEVKMTTGVVDGNTSYQLIGTDGSPRSEPYSTIDQTLQQLSSVN